MLQKTSNGLQKTRQKKKSNLTEDEIDVQYWLDEQKDVEQVVQELNLRPRSPYYSDNSSDFSSF